MRRGGERRDGTLGRSRGSAAARRSRPTRSTRPGAACSSRTTSPLDVRHLVRALASIRMTDRVWAGEASSSVAAADCLRLAEIVFGGADAIAAEPVVFANCNVNSPLRFDVRMLEGIVAYAARGAGRDRDAVPADGRDGAGVGAGGARAADRRGARGHRAGAARPARRAVRDGVVPLDTDMKNGSPAFGGPESAFGLHASGPDRAAPRAALALGRRHAHGEPGDRLPGRLRVHEHAAVGVPRRRQRRAGSRPAGSRAASSPRSRSSSPTARCSTSCCASSRRSRWTRRASPSAPTSRSATAATSSAPSTRSSASASASGGRRSRRPTTSTAGRAAARSTTPRAPRRAWRELLESYERPPLDDAIEEELVEFVERRAVELGDPAAASR